MLLVLSLSQVWAHILVQIILAAAIPVTKQSQDVAALKQLQPNRILNQDPNNISWTNGIK